MIPCMTSVLRQVTTTAPAALAVALAAAVYLNALGNPFVFDDTTEVLENRSIQRPTEIAALIRYTPTRPMVNLSYALDYAIWGLEPFGFHLTNLLLHLINVALFFLLARGYAIDTGRGTLVPFTAAALFAVHPLLTEAVGYVSSRSELLSGAFILSSLCAFRAGLSRGGGRWLFVGVLAFALAGASKETGAVLPFVLLAYDRWVLPDGGAWTPRQRFLRVHAPLIALVMAAGAYRVWRYLALEHPGTATIDWNNALLNLHVLTLYLSLFVVPVSLSLVHDIKPVLSLFDWRVLGGAAVLGGLLWQAATWRRREPLITLGIFWFLLVLVPSATLIVVGERGQPIAEHRVYVASCGLFLAAAAGWVRAVQDVPGRTRDRVRIGVPAVAILVFAMLTVARNRVWADPVVLWEDAARKAPTTFMAQYGVGESYRAVGDCEHAIPAYQRAITVRPSIEDGYLGLAECLRLSEKTDDARAVLRTALQRAETTQYSRLTLASLEADRGNPAEAVRLCQEVLASAPGEANAIACIERNHAAQSR